MGQMATSDCSTAQGSLMQLLRQKPAQMPVTWEVVLACPDGLESTRQDPEYESFHCWPLEVLQQT